MSKVQQIEVARYELRFFSFTVERVNDKHYLVVYRKWRERNEMGSA